jgi:inorganic pyrophosphatase
MAIPVSLARPAALDRLGPRDGAASAYVAVIEAAQGSRNKLKYEPALGVFKLHAVLPLGTAFPYDFGFIPGTLGDDGDPLDVLVFMDEAAPASTVVPCRLVGVIEATQTRGARRVRNDRLLAVALESHRYRGCRTLRDIPREVLREIELFFAFYNAQKGQRFVVGRRGGPSRARMLVGQGARRLQARDRPSRAA